MNDIQYTKYLFDSVKKISFANPGVIRDTYGKGENLTHEFLIKEANNFTKDTGFKYYPWIPFILERLINVYVEINNLNVAYKL